MNALIEEIGATNLLILAGVSVVCAACALVLAWAERRELTRDLHRLRVDNARARAELIGADPETLTLVHQLHGELEERGEQLADAHDSLRAQAARVRELEANNARLAVTLAELLRADVTA